ncbi:MAG: FAD-dependent oxidoreductase [Spirochaetales bacterium]|nr:FAD-dependent oxidoreductase [Spirochaetales bacterium]
MFLAHYQGIFTTHSIPLIRIRQEEHRLFLFDFDSQSITDWQAGEHGIFALPANTRIKRKRSWRAFSILSLPEEGLLRFATQIPEECSAYKSALLRLRQGDEILLRGPFGPFLLPKENNPLIFIANGIGITPFRSMAATLAERDDSRPLGLLHMAHLQEHPLRPDMEGFLGNRTNTVLRFLTNREGFADGVRESVGMFGGEERYYLAGSQSFIRDVKRLLRFQGVPRRHINTDAFWGLSHS